MASDTAVLNGLLETTEDPVVVLDATGTVEECNQSARELAAIDDCGTGLDVGDFFDAVPALANNRFSESLDGTTITVTEDGTERSFEVTASTIEDESCETQGQIVRLEEVTRAKERARELALNRERYHTLFESDQLVLWEQDFSEAMAYVEELATDIEDVSGYLDSHPEELGRIFDRVKVLDVNQRALEFFGVSSRAELEDNLDKLLTEKSIRGMSEMWQALLDGETTFRRECEARQFDSGEYRHELLEVNVPESEEDDYSRVYTASVDITEQKRREQELERAKERYHRILDRFSDYVLICSEDGVIDYISPGVEPTLGYDPSELVGTDAFELIHPTDTEDVQTVFSEMLANPDTERTIEYRTQARDGSYRWTEARGSNYLDDSFLGGIMVTIRDVTERKSHEQELRSKNELLDEFAEVVSHDVATPLGVIKNKARLIEITEDSSHATDIYEATERVQSLVDELEALAREGKQVGDIGTVDIERVSRDAWETVESPYGTLVIDSSTMVEADRGRLQQLLENLLTNAVEHGSTPERDVVMSDGIGQGRQPPSDTDAMPEDGSRVTIRVGAFEEGIYVADDGPGIPESDYDTVFEKGYSTSDNGTGLGLAIVRRIAEGHGWSVVATESDAGGARFEIRTEK
jgi:PAS domain S-box-containing protein